MKKFLIICFTLLHSSLCFAQSKESLNIYNWSNYIEPSVIKQFEHEYNIKINYDVFDSNYTLESKILMIKKGYDIVFPSATPFAMRQIKAGLFSPLNFAKIPNYKNLDSKILSIIENTPPLKQYVIPYLWGTTGIAINNNTIPNQNVTAAHDSLANIFDKNIAKEFAKCGIEIIDNPAEIVPLAHKFFGLNPHSQSLEDLDFIMSKLNEIRPLIKNINNYSYIENIITGESCIALGFSGDIIQAKKKLHLEDQKYITYYRPKEIFEFGLDTIAIINTSTNKENAYKFINFLLDPKVTAKITNHTYYPNANKKSKKYINNDILNDNSIYFDINSEKSLFFPKEISDSYERARNKAWLKFISHKK